MVRSPASYIILRQPRLAVAEIGFLTAGAATGAGGFRAPRGYLPVIVAHGRESASSPPIKKFSAWSTGLAFGLPTPSRQRSARRTTARS